MLRSLLYNSIFGAAGEVKFRRSIWRLARAVAKVFLEIGSHCVPALTSLNYRRLKFSHSYAPTDNVAVALSPFRWRKRCVDNVPAQFRRLAECWVSGAPPCQMHLAFENWSPKPSGSTAHSNSSVATSRSHIAICAALIAEATACGNVDGIIFPARKVMPFDNELRRTLKRVLLHCPRRQLPGAGHAAKSTSPNSQL